MSIAALRAPVTAPAALYLGPATVVELLGAAPLVEMPHGPPRRAEMALAFPYAPVVGDTLLVAAHDQACYVIGVLRAGGEVSLRFFGDVSLHAVGGKLRLAADDEVIVESPRTEVRTGKLEVFADTLVQKVDSMYQRVRKTLRLHAGERVELCDGDWHARAERMTVATRGVVAINGKEVHLG